MFVLESVVILCKEWCATFFAGGVNGRELFEKKAKTEARLAPAGDGDEAAAPAPAAAATCAAHDKPNRAVGTKPSLAARAAPNFIKQVESNAWAIYN